MQLLIGPCSSDQVGGAQRRGVRCEQFIIPENRNIFSEECDVLLHLISSPVWPHVTEMDAEDPTRRRIAFNPRYQKKGKRVIKCFPRFPVKLFQDEIYLSSFMFPYLRERSKIYLSKENFNVDRSIFKIYLLKLFISETFTLDMSIHQLLFHKL